MKTKTAEKIDAPTIYAAQNARLGLINVGDLSLLTGVDVGRLNRFAKTGSMVHYGEYHGKRFFNFQEIINWVSEPDDENVAKPVVRANHGSDVEEKHLPIYVRKSHRRKKSSHENCLEGICRGVVVELKWFVELFLE